MNKSNTSIVESSENTERARTKKPNFIRSSLSLTEKDLDRLNKFKDVLELHTNSAAVSTLLKFFDQIDGYVANGDDVYFIKHNHTTNKDEKYRFPWWPV